MEAAKKLKWYHPKSLLDKVFSVGITIKGIDGLIELITAVALIFIRPQMLHDLVDFTLHDELVKDPHDFVANFILNSSQHFTDGTRIFLIAYLLIHAAVKLVAVIGIWRNQLWAYPFSLIALGILTLYQVYDIIFVKPSIWMILLTIFDIFILWLIWREYGKIRRKGFPAGKRSEA